MLEFFQALRLDHLKAHVERELHATALYLGSLKRLRKQRRNQMFSNSRMLPEMRNLCGSDGDGVAYWRDHKGPVTFDCCAMHRSRKQNLLRIAAESMTSELTGTYESRASERALRKYHWAAQLAIRNTAPIDSVDSDRQRVLYRRAFRTGDYESLHYQLQLTERRLQRMLTRRRMAENFTPSPKEVPVESVAPSSTRAEQIDNCEPIDVWYDLADSQATPPIMLRWLREHSNPYISNRAGKTLNVLSKAS